ncbi:4-carboxy-4-hydroxy-2-oxoadipate aldolase/oxaloacetate decarboxylase [Pseudonocardia pini]|uniref:4-carboxy-4-hydroxy-2-oxoadipate aldolase/oxaloacetate decarboxylase n=1 Tax=Pseudonocardia pini TaxID=2758030 RepID=UPI0015F11D43|nr:4-carboxy-4-hydroxy-2-oxoadipate aldolase/oxaloacetate decarboxylase [Pseudonocardia pini]
MTVYLRIPAADPELLAAVEECAVADLHEAMGSVLGFDLGRAALLDPAIRPLVRGVRISGQAVTVRTNPTDGLYGHRAIRLLQPGQILVASTGGFSSAAMFAELTALAARANGARGAVVDGPVRDSDALEEMGFPVWSRGTYAGHTDKAGPGAVNVPVVCGGVLVEPGDVVVADGDGVISLPLASAAAVVAAARTRVEREKGIRAAIDRGEQLFDLLGLQVPEEYDRAWKD